MFVQKSSCFVCMETTFISSCCCSTLRVVPPVQHWAPLQVIQSSSEAPAACSTHSFCRPTTLLFLSNARSQWCGSYGEREREKDCDREKMTVRDRTRERGSERWHRVTSVIALAVETHKPNPCSPLFTATLPLLLSLSLSFSFPFSESMNMLLCSQKPYVLFMNYQPSSQQRLFS